MEAGGPHLRSYCTGNKTVLVPDEDLLGAKLGCNVTRFVGPHIDAVSGFVTRKRTTRSVVNPC